MKRRGKSAGPVERKQAPEREQWPFRGLEAGNQILKCEPAMFDLPLQDVDPDRSQAIADQKMLPAGRPSRNPAEGSQRLEVDAIVARPRKRADRQNEGMDFGTPHRPGVGD
jgi:hypothetical protein